jgi:hypothetical protein
MTMTQYQIIPSRFGYALSARPGTPTWTPPVFNTKITKQTLEAERQDAFSARSSS